MSIENSSRTKNCTSASRTILLSGFVAGTLDMLGAIVVYCVIMKVVTLVQLLRGIASGIFGKNTVGSEITTAFIGLALHYIIAFCFAIAYFIIYPHISFLRKQKIISGLLYGVLVWIIMNQLVLPLSNGHKASFHLRVH